MPKSYDQNVTWKKGNNANYLIAQFIPSDSNDSLKGTIPGVSVQIDHKRPIRIKSSNKTVITLFKLKKGTKLRAYQVEPCDEEKISSRNGDEIVYGCHEHTGEELNKINKLHDIEDISGWFNFFCDKVHLEFSGTLENTTHDQ